MLEFDKLVSVLNDLQQLNYRIVTNGVTGGLCSQLAYAYLARLNRTLHAVALLVPHGHAAELMILMRPIAEASIRVRWMGADSTKAERLIDDAKLQTGVLADRWLHHGFTTPEHVAAAHVARNDVIERRGGTRKELKLIPLEEMEHQIWGQGSAPIYDLFFRRGSADAHASAESASRALAAESEEDCRRALQFTVASASLLLEASLPLLNCDEQLRRQAGEISAALSINWSPA